MTAHTIETVPASVANSPQAYPLPEEVDKSCRWPLIVLFGHSIFWLIVSLLFGILASVKMHAPGMLADVAALTYGRAAAASSSTLLYGFASQAGIAAALWLFARMGRTFLVMPAAAIAGAVLWNAGVLLGTLGILFGGVMQFPAYQMPAWTSVFFMVAFLLLGLSGLLTFVARTVRELYPSNWFLFAAFFIFPWITAVAYLLLGRYELRGVVDPSIAIWYANNFIMLWLGSIALAVIFYFVPKISGRPLFSYEMAIFSFWFYLLAATASGFQNTPGLPAWMPALSTAVNFLMIIPAGLILYNWYGTWAGHSRARKEREPSSKYIAFAMLGFLGVVALTAILSFGAVDEVVGLTIFQQGVLAWTLYGFIGMALFGAISHVLPRLTNVEWPSSRMTSVHYGLTAAGLVIVALGLMLGGYVQGGGINDPSVPFTTVAKRVVPFIGISSIGLILLLAGQVAILWNFILMLKSSITTCCGFGSREVAR